MDVQESYNIWAGQYDTSENKTRDLEAIALRATLANIDVDNCLEIGCGTGKNTAWLMTKANHVTAVDLSGEMLAKARAKINSDKVHFVQADITKDWSFADKQFDMVTFSLVLEHIEHLDAVFERLSQSIVNGGHVYIGELHPFKQYTGTKARFETKEGTNTVTCFTHNLSDFTKAAQNNGFSMVALSEYFDDNDRTTIPRILTLLLKQSRQSI